MLVKRIIHLEGAVMLLAMIYLYAIYGFKWWIFLLFLLAPDLSMLAYLLNNRVGSLVYNIFHNYVISILIILAGLFFQNDLVLITGIIWTAHIGMDRLFGFGLKYKTAFKDTHLQKL